MAGYRILDISAYQKNVPYSALPSYGIKGAILRVTERYNVTDSMFEKHWNGCNSVNLECGVYKYSYADNINEIKKEAEQVVKVLNGRQVPLGVWLDLENSNQANLPRSVMTSMVIAFREIIVNAGYAFGIYCNSNWYKNILDTDSLPFDYWIAAYPYNDTGVIVNSLRPGFGVGWQYTSHFKINGENYDCSVFDKKFIDELLIKPLFTDGSVQGNTAGNIPVVPSFTSVAAATAQAAEPKTSDFIEAATSWMEDLANDSSHGYDQRYRWGEYGDYDCSSATIQAWENAGVPVKTDGATYTGNMYSVFIDNGFKDVTSEVSLSSGSGIKRGDVLLNHSNHVAMSVGNGKLVQASINEFGGVSGGSPGDQTGNEIHIRSYYNYPWDCVLRYTGGKSEPIQAETVDYYGRTTASVLNIRKSASTNSSIVGTYKSGSIVHITKEYGNWGYTGSGWVFLDYVDDIVDTETYPYVGKVTANVLNVRTGSGTNNPNLPSYPRLNKGNLVDVYKKIYTDKGEWLYIRIAAKYYGYVSAKYIQRV